MEIIIRHYPAHPSKFKKLLPKDVTEALWKSKEIYSPATTEEVAAEIKKMLPASSVEIFIRWNEIKVVGFDYPAIISKYIAEEQWVNKRSILDYAATLVYPDKTHIPSEFVLLEEIIFPRYTVGSATVSYDWSLGKAKLGKDDIILIADEIIAGDQADIKINDYKQGLIDIKAELEKRGYDAEINLGYRGLVGSIRITGPLKKQPPEQKQTATKVDNNWRKV